MICTAWGTIGEGSNTLVEGEGPPRFVNGDLHGDCPDLLRTFEAEDFEDAKRQWDDWRFPEVAKAVES